MYGIKPCSAIEYFIKNKYIVLQNNIENNIKQSNAIKLKQVLKENDLQVTGLKNDLIKRVINNIQYEYLKKHFSKDIYILTDKGTTILEKNKRVFMSEREKAGKDFEELTNLEFSQLQVLNRVEEYRRLKYSELSFKKGYKKNDILWCIYNTQKDIYIRKRDYVMAGVVYDRMHDVLDNEKKNELALNFYLCAIYLFEYERPRITSTLENKYIKEIVREMNKSNKTKDQVINCIAVNIEKYFPNLYKEKKINDFIEKVSKSL